MPAKKQNQSPKLTAAQKAAKCAREKAWKAAFNAPGAASTHQMKMRRETLSPADYVFQHTNVRFSPRQMPTPLNVQNWIESMEVGISNRVGLALFTHNLRVNRYSHLLAFVKDAQKFAKMRVADKRLDAGWDIIFRYFRPNKINASEALEDAVLDSLEVGAPTTTFDETVAFVQEVLRVQYEQ